MKFLVLAINYYPELVGSAKFTYEMVQWLSNKSQKIIVITTNPFYPEWVCKNNTYNRTFEKNVTIIRCPVYVPKKLNGITRSLHYLSFFISSLPIVIFYGLRKIDVAFTICPTILSAPSILLISFFKKFLTNKKIISWIHYADLEIEAAFQLNLFKSMLLKKLLLKYEDIILRNFDLISSISFFMNEKLKFKTKGRKEIFYLPDFIETKNFSNLAKEKESHNFYKQLSLEKGQKVIMYSGSINEKLSCESIIKTITFLESRKDIIWVICGEGPKKSYLQDKLGKLKNVKFFGFQPSQKLPEWINLADIHLIPQKLTSVKFCLPSKLLGILACGKPIVGIAPPKSELGNVLEVHGIRLSDEDPKKMSEALIKLIDNNDLRNQLGKRGQDYIKKFHQKDLILNNILLKIKAYKYS